MKLNQWTTGPFRCRLAAALLIFAWAGTALAGDDCCRPPRSFWPHIVFIWPLGTYGRSTDHSVGQGTCYSGPPRGTLFGYYQNHWQPWPEGYAYGSPNGAPQQETASPWESLPGPPLPPPSIEPEADPNSPPTSPARATDSIGSSRRRRVADE